MVPDEMELLVHDAGAGDKESFLRLCELNGKKILYFCIKMMGNLQDGEDAAQEVFLKMLHNIGSLKDPAAFKFWLNKIIVNTCNNMRRNTLKGGSTMPLDLLADTLPDSKSEFLPSEYLEDREKRSQLLHCIDGLSPKYRQAILLYYYEDMSQKEIAEVLGCSVNSVDHTLRRARETIKTQLGTASGGTVLAGVLPAGGVPVLAQVLHLEQETLVSPTMIQQVMAASGVLGAPMASGTAASLAATKAHSLTSFIAWVSCIAVAVAAIGSTTAYAAYTALTPSPTASSATPADGAVPQLSPFGGVVEEVVDTPLLTPLSGQVYFKDASGAVLPDAVPIADGFEVTCLQADGTALATVPVNAQGAYTFENLYLSQAGTYTLRFTSPYSRALTFASDNPGGVLTLTLTPGKGPAEDPVLYLTDVEAPSIGISLYNAAGNNTNLNPATAGVEIGDETPVSCRWQIVSDASGQVIAEGTSINEPIPVASLCRSAPAGRYHLAVTATDLAGNTTTESCEFHLVN